MKKFKMTHLFLKGKEPTEFSEDNPPEWLTSKTFRWWWEEYVLKLEVGKSIKTDFQKIERLS